MIIRNCNIIDCTGREPYFADVKIENGIIREIGSNLAGDTEIDAKDGYLLPGLANLHVHISRRHLSRGSGLFRSSFPEIENGPDARRILYAARNAWWGLRHGITTFRDTCSTGRTASELKAAIEQGIIRGPHLYVCGLGIAITGGHGTHRAPECVEVDGVDEVLKATRYEIKLGVDFIKLSVSGGLGGMPEHEHPGWSEFTVEEIQAACIAAHSHQKGVTVHAMGELPVMNSLLGGVDGIEHGTVLTERALDIMEERGVYYVPTASGITTLAQRELTTGNKELGKTIWEIVVEPQRESIRKAHARGLLIGAGSDTLGSVPMELQIFESCGFTRYEALQTATINAAKILKNENHFGTVECGKVADLIVLKKNPLDDLANIETVQRVFLGGEEVNEAWMCNLQ